MAGPSGSQRRFRDEVFDVITREFASHGSFFVKLVKTPAAYWRSARGMFPVSEAR